MSSTTGRSKPWPAGAGDSPAKPLKWCSVHSAQYSCASCPRCAAGTGKARA